MCDTAVNIPFSDVVEFIRVHTRLVFQQHKLFFQRQNSCAFLYIHRQTRLEIILLKEGEEEQTLVGDKITYFF